jgi:hypothetical protein
MKMSTSLRTNYLLTSMLDLYNIKLEIYNYQIYVYER